MERLLHLTKRSKLLKKVKIVKMEVCEAIINMMEVASTTYADIIEEYSFRGEKYQQKYQQMIVLGRAE